MQVLPETGEGISDVQQATAGTKFPLLSFTSVSSVCFFSVFNCKASFDWAVC